MFCGPFTLHLINHIDLGGPTHIMNLPYKIKTAAVLVAVGALLTLTACGGGSGGSIDDAPSSSVATVVPRPTEAPKPTIVISTPAPPPIAPVVPPTAAPTAAPTATPEPPKVFDEFGFVLELDRGAFINSLSGNTDSQGMVQLEYSGVNVILSWVPINGVTNEGLVSGMFEMLRGSQKDLTLDTVSESNFNVGLESGLVIGFKSVDLSGGVIGGGLGGAWNCLDAETSFTIAVTGQDANVVQLRFNWLINNFECDQS